MLNELIIYLQLGSQVGLCSTKARSYWEYLSCISIFSGDTWLVGAAVVRTHVGG